MINRVRAEVDRVVIESISRVGRCGDDYCWMPGSCFPSIRCSQIEVTGGIRGRHRAIRPSEFGAWGSERHWLDAGLMGSDAPSNLPMPGLTEQPRRLPARPTLRRWW